MLEHPIICHATMCKILRRYRLQIHSQIQPFDDRNARNIIISLRKSAFNASVVFIVLVICYCPYLVVPIVYFIGKAGELRLEFLLSTTVVFLNSALNPFLYCWRIREFRLAALRTFRHSPLTKKTAMKVKRHYGLHTSFFGKQQTGSKIFFHTTMVHTVSVLVTAP